MKNVANLSLLLPILSSLCFVSCLLASLLLLINSSKSYERKLLSGIFLVLSLLCFDFFAYKTKILYQYLFLFQTELLLLLFNGLCALYILYALQRTKDSTKNLLFIVPFLLYLIIQIDIFATNSQYSSLHESPLSYDKFKTVLFCVFSFIYLLKQVHIISQSSKQKNVSDLKQKKFHLMQLLIAIEVISIIPVYISLISSKKIDFTILYLVSLILLCFLVVYFYNSPELLYPLIKLTGLLNLT